MIHSIYISKQLPFVPTKEICLFVDNGCCNEYIATLKHNYYIINSLFNHYGFTFGFIPAILDNIPFNMLNYYAPFLKKTPQFDNGADILYNYIGNKDELEKIIGPALLFYSGNSTALHYEFKAYPFPYFDNDWDYDVLYEFQDNIRTIIESVNSTSLPPVERHIIPIDKDGLIELRMELGSIFYDDEEPCSEECDDKSDPFYRLKPITPVINESDILYSEPEFAKQTIVKNDDKLYRTAEPDLPDNVDSGIRFRVTEPKQPLNEDSGTRFRTAGTAKPIEIFNNNDFDTESKQMLEEIAALVEKLELKGYDRFCISQYIDSHNDIISSLVITKDYRIMLPEYNIEITMTPLHKTLYLLFLKHPEGIILKHLPDYRDELKQLYKDIMGKHILLPRHIKSIDNLTNSSLNNSINEKCSRIREAFVSKFDDRLASNYYITGKRGELKGVKLSSDLIVWEQ